MSRKRTQSGSTLALVAACTVLLVLIGIGISILMELIGGKCELQDATDAGCLNVAKQLSVTPHYMTDPYKIAQFKLCCERDNSGALMLKGGTSDQFPQGQPVVNLRTYNKLIGQAMLVAMNAEAEKTPDATANANRLIDYLCGKDGIANAVTKDIESKAKNPSKDDDVANPVRSFTKVYESNSVRMLGTKPTQQKDSQFAVAYVGQDDSDRGATNLLMPASDQVPPGLSGNEIPKSSDGKYVRGYRSIKFAGIDSLLMGLPAQPDEQPHLVSAYVFANQSSLPKGIIAPPNSFENAAMERDKITHYRLRSVGHSIIGVLDKKYKPTIPGGFIVVHNSGGNLNTKMGDFTSVLNGELYDGIEVERAANGNFYFSSTPGLFDLWNKYIKDGEQDPNKAPNYDSGKIKDMWMVPGKNGHPDTTQPPQQVKFADAKSERFTAHCLCNDTNTHSDKRLGGSPICTEMLPAFEKEYSPGFDGHYTKKADNSSNLTAVETLKADLEHLFNDSGFLTSDAGQNMTTGIRIYNNGLGHNTPWPQYETGPDNVKFFSGDGPFNPKIYNFPQISHDGNLQELINQVCNADPQDSKNGNNAQAEKYVDNIKQFLKNRLAQISGKTGADLDADVKTIMTTKIPMGADRYIYYNDDGYGNMTVLQALVTTPPPMLNYALPSNPFAKKGIANFATATADGIAQADMTVDSNEYWPAKVKSDVVFTLVDSKFDHETDKYPFQYHRGKIGLEQKITVIPSSGFNNLLGEINLQEIATPSAKLYFGQPN